MLRKVDVCPICHVDYASVKHHLIFGSSKRRLADEDNLCLWICDDCHTMGSLTARIHDNIAAEALSKMLGQSMYECDRVAEGCTKEQARQEFIKRYGLSYL